MQRAGAFRSSHCGKAASISKASEQSWAPAISWRCTSAVEVISTFAFSSDHISGHSGWLHNVLGNFCLNCRLPPLRKELSYSMHWLPFISCWKDKSSSGLVMLSALKRFSDNSKRVSPQLLSARKCFDQCFWRNQLCWATGMTAIGELDFWSLSHSEFKDEGWVDLVCPRSWFAYSWFSYQGFLSDKGKIFLRMKYLGFFLSGALIVPVASFLGQLGRTWCDKTGLQIRFPLGFVVVVNCSANHGNVFFWFCRQCLSSREPGCAVICRTMSEQFISATFMLQGSSVQLKGLFCYMTRQLLHL